MIIYESFLEKTPLVRKLLGGGLSAPEPPPTPYGTEPAHLFVTGGLEITSNEGTTQGDPGSMAVYVLSTLPLLSIISTTGTRHVAFADDMSASWPI